jgi:four helix bundle protein
MPLDSLLPAARCQQPAITEVLTPIRNYRDLIAWQRAMDLCVDVYRTTKKLPREEIYGLTNQIRRASVSIPSNIAEGQGRGGDREWRQYLRIAYGSLREVETQAMLAGRLGYITETDVQRLLDNTAEVGRLVNGLLKRLSGDE